MRVLALSLLLAGAASCAPQGVFRCGYDEQCISPAGERGSCEDNHFCSFADPGCGSGRRYGHYAGDGLGGQCVVAAQDGGHPSDRPDPGCGLPGEDCCPDSTCQDGSTCVAGKCPEH